MFLKQWGGVLTGCAALLLTACTVVDLDENGKPILPADPNAKHSFDNQTPQQIAQQTWQTRVIDPASRHALDAATLGSHLTSSANSQESVFIHLVTPIVKLDDSNPREQNITVSINGQPLTIQTGPVMKGNAIRDASGFKFEDFTNQVQFAQLSRAYNREAAKQLPKIDASWVGKPVSVRFAVTLNHGTPQDAAALELKQEVRP
ncbi:MULTISPECIES: DUF2291 family protein [Enterobacteriaceae]|uniref:DUF2291 family protein n=1 Tax=Enterobacteriaceae TaxID=543 RepID=UPI0012AE3278|nr:MULTISPECIES: DUF2291 family protein [Enterobacteriaceae]MRT47723.1 DUF2291 family protein [Raoultella sp. RIT712]QNK10084.1 DUF2291 family protein [Enterobacter sp. JUb54]